jgi:Flp pilus assembly protein TadD
MDQEILQVAVGHHQRGELDAAEALYHQVLASTPDDPNALHLLGLIRHQRGDSPAALDLIRRALQLNPYAASFYLNLAAVCKHLGRNEDAADAYYRALALDGAKAQTWLDLAEVLAGLGRHAEAEAAARHVIDLQPENPTAHLQLAAALNSQNRFEESLRYLRRVRRLFPDEPGLCSLAGVALLGLGKLAPARRALRQALRLSPGFAPAHYNLGLALLLGGNLRQGWPEYEWRGATSLFELRRGTIGRPVWDGGPLRGKRLLVHAEQGAGDAIQFARYVPLLAQRGARVILECLPSLRRLFEPLPVEQLLTVDEPLPEFDLHVPLLGLPRRFATALRSIPASGPFLRAPADSRAAWQRRIGAYSGLKVGLAWQGRRGNPYDSRRSMPVEALLPLVRVPGVKLFSLQKDWPGPPSGLVDLDPWLTDFADTAAAIECLDLVISVDTAVAHLAGALGKPVWVLLPRVPDWRWLMDRPDSPWYPSARLIRQRQAGDWRGVVNDAREALLALVHDGAAARGSQVGA